MGADAPIKRKLSYPTITKSEHDFRKEYRGSVLEKKFRRNEESRLQMTWRSLTHWLLPKRKVIDSSAEAPSPIEKVPNEILYQILSYLDNKTVIQCRRVRRRWSQLSEEILQIRNLPKIEISRLVISTAKKALVLRRVNYEKRLVRTLTVSVSQVNQPIFMGFCFRRLSPERIVFENMTLTDALVDFLRLQLIECDIIKRLIFKNVNFCEANSLTLHRLLAPIAKKVECLEVVGCYGMRPESLTDCHIAQFDASKLKSIRIEDIKFVDKFSILAIGDESLKGLIEAENYPFLHLESCLITTATVSLFAQRKLTREKTEVGFPETVCHLRRCKYVCLKELSHRLNKMNVEVRDPHKKEKGGRYTLFSSKNATFSYIYFEHAKDTRSHQLLFKSM